MPLAPRTLSEYQAALKRVQLAAPASGSGFGDAMPQQVSPASWQHLTNSGRLVLRAAIKWAYKENGQEALGVQIAETIPLQKEVKRIKKNPSREDVTKFVAVVKDYPSPWRDILLLCVSLGFRREEILLLDRIAVEEALKSKNEIIRFVRKGSIEDELPISHVKNQLKALLRQPMLLGGDAQVGKNAPEWEVVWQVVGSSYRSAYERLKRHVAKVSKEAGCSTHWTPHTMRHAFASEMARDGASLSAIQEALNHSSYQTSLRYVHVDAQDLKTWMKPRGDDK